MRWIKSFDVGAVMQQLPYCTVMMGVPTYYTRLLAEPAFTAQSCARMRLFISGSAPLLAETSSSLSDALVTPYWSGTV